MAGLTVKLPWQDGPACHLRNKKRNHLNIITTNSIRGRIKPLFFSELGAQNYKFDSHGERAKTTILPKQHWKVNCLDKIGQGAITKEKYSDIFTINIIRGNIKHLFKQASVLEITNLTGCTDRRMTSHESHNVSLLAIVCAVVCASPLAFTRVKNSLTSVCQEATICQASGNLPNQFG